MADLTIYVGNKNYSSWSLRGWLALAQVGAPFSEVVIPLDRPDTAGQLARWSPSGRVPVLRHGELVVWDSLAMCEYLAETFPAARLWPADARARAVGRAAAAEMHAGFAALRQELPMDIRAAARGKTWSTAAQRDIDRIVALWTDLRARFGSPGGGPFLLGDFSVADAMFAPVATRFRTYAVPVEGEAAAYAGALWELPAMQRWIAAARAEPWEIPTP
jgi:glutathione S-transferase